MQFTGCLQAGLWLRPINLVHKSVAAGTVSAVTAQTG